MAKKAITKTFKKATAKTKVKPAKPKISPPATKPKSKIPAAAIPIAAVGAATVGAGIAGSRKNKGGKTFDDAFRTAREKGEGTKFTFNCKSYVAVTKDDLKKKGYGTDTAGLRAYNRAGGKAAPKIDVKFSLPIAIA